MSKPVQIEGADNYGKPRQEFANKVAELSDESFVTEAKERIWLSAYASSNPRSDYHWQADLCYDEAQRRGNPKLYTEAFKRASA